MDEIRLVYSTESGRVCPECNCPKEKCVCKKKNAEKTVYPDDGIVRIRREVKGRKGKTVTSVFGIPLADIKLKQFAKILKRRCGTGGAIKDGVILVQGDHRDTLLDEIRKQGYTVKIAGG
jgi:translation initiation factor 1